MTVIKGVIGFSLFKKVEIRTFWGIILVMLCQCSNDSRIVFPQTNTCGIIDGYIDPPVLGAKVYLINVVAVDSVLLNVNTGYFQFRDIAYGTYKIEVKADSFGTASSIVKLTSGIYTIGSVSMSRYPSQIVAIEPRENSKIDYIHSTFVNDTLVKFCFSFKNQLNRKTFEDNFLISPEIPFEISDESVTDYGHDIFITLSALDIFSNPIITFTFKKDINTIYFEPLEFDYSIKYFPDTSKIEDVIKSYFFSSITPSDNSQLIAINSDVQFQFKKPMDHKSVEDALRINPVSNYKVIWTTENSEEFLAIRFSELLKKGTTYTIIIDSTAFTEDSVKLTYPVCTRFTTDLMRCISIVPSYREMYVPCSKVLTYTFNYPVDSAGFITSFFITPPMDSLQFLFYDNNRTVMVLHPDFIIDTTYTVVIDTSLKAYSGEHIASSIIQTFYTGMEDSLGTLTCIQKTYPADTIAQIETSENLLVTFTGAMDRSLVNERISIAPALPFDLVWMSNATLQIKQLQPLKSNTKYTVTLDSGYMTLDHNIWGSGYTFQFKTKPLRLVSYYPLDGQVNVSCDQDIMLMFSTPVDTLSLLSNSYFNPPVDSISCQRDTDGRYYIRHARLLSDYEYKFVVSDSLADKYGSVSGTSFTINFLTVKQ